MDNLQVPNGYELLDSRGFYAHYLSHEDRGIIGGITLLESGGVQLDLFNNGEIMPIVSKSIITALEFSGDIEYMKGLN